jgi:hypothetical protein
LFGRAINATLTVSLTVLKSGQEKEHGGECRDYNVQKALPDYAHAPTFFHA